jgi:hypothetical protein
VVAAAEVVGVAVAVVGVAVAVVMEAAAAEAAMVGGTEAAAAEAAMVGVAAAVAATAAAMAEAAAVVTVAAATAAATMARAIPGTPRHPPPDAVAPMTSQVMTTAYTAPEKWATTMVFIARAKSVTIMACTSAASQVTTKDPDPPPKKPVANVFSSQMRDSLQSFAHSGVEHRDRFATSGHESNFLSARRKNAGV